MGCEWLHHDDGDDDCDDSGHQFLRCLEMCANDVDDDRDGAINLKSNKKIWRLQVDSFIRMKTKHLLYVDFRDVRMTMVVGKIVFDGDDDGDDDADFCDVFASI